MAKILAILVLIGLVVLPTVAVADPAPPPIPPAASQGCDQVSNLIDQGIIPPSGANAILNFGVCRGK